MLPIDITCKKFPLFHRREGPNSTAPSTTTDIACLQWPAGCRQQPTYILPPHPYASVPLSSFFTPYLLFCPSCIYSPTTPVTLRTFRSLQSIGAATPPVLTCPPPPLARLPPLGRLQPVFSMQAGCIPQAALFSSLSPPTCQYDVAPVALAS